MAEKEASESVESNVESTVEEDKGSGDWWALTNSIMAKAADSVSQATNVAVAKSSEVYGLVSRDLGEVSSQASAAVGSTANVVKEKLVLGSEWLYCDANKSASYSCFSKEGNRPKAFDEKTDEMADAAVESVTQSVSSLWKMASGYAINMFTEEDDPGQAMLVTKDRDAVPLDRLQAQLFALAADPATFLEDLDKSEDKVEVDLDSREGEIADLLQSNKKIRDYYNAFVPDEVSHALFWRRYFQRVHQLEVQESRRQELKRRAELVARAADSDSEINWDEVGDLTTPSVAPSEAEQQRILIAYENELSQKDKKSNEQGDSSSSRASPENEKGSNASDDWEKLSSGEKTPNKKSDDK